jgi:ATP-binding cassette subfamily C (CFTR/MRP) protein 1
VAINSSLVDHGCCDRRPFLLGTTFAQPFLISRAIELASVPSFQPYSNIGYGLIGAYVIAYVGIAISNGQYEHRMYRVATMMRGSVVPFIFRKTLQLDLADVKPVAALTLISTNMETITQGIILMHEVWASAIEIGLAVYLLERQLGAASAVPVRFAPVVLFITGGVAVFIGKSQAAWILSSQKRVAKTSSTLENMKWLKLSGLNKVNFNIIRKLRIEELKVSQRYRKLLLAAMTLSLCAPTISPVLTFLTFNGLAVRNHDTLTINIAFTSLSLFASLNKPLTMLIFSLPTIAGAAASFQRIQDYLM